MEESNRPPFAPYVYEVIEKSLHEVDKAHWAALRDLWVPYPTDPKSNLSPHPPKLPEHLRTAVCFYARELFKKEANEYPIDPQIEHWLFKLQERVIERVISAVRQIDSTIPLIAYVVGLRGKYGLSWHGLSDEEMRRAMSESLDDLRASTLASYQEALAPTLPISAAETGTEVDAVAVDPVINGNRTRPGNVDLLEYRATLLAEYKAANGNPSNMSLYKAQNSGIHKPDFYAWLKGTLPERSKVTRRFEAFLRAKKLPIPRKPTS